MGAVVDEIESTVAATEGGACRKVRVVWDETAIGMDFAPNKIPSSLELSGIVIILSPSGTTTALPFLALSTENRA
jgi:hypothetical protein